MTNRHVSLGYSYRTSCDKEILSEAYATYLRKIIWTFYTYDSDWLTWFWDMNWARMLWTYRLIPIFVYHSYVGSCFQQPWGDRIYAHSTRNLKVATCYINMKYEGDVSNIERMFLKIQTHMFHFLGI